MVRALGGAPVITRQQFFASLILVAVGLTGERALALDVPLVYVRCPRSDAPRDFTVDVTIGGVTTPQTRTMHGLDIYDVLPDVTHLLGDFSASCDLMLQRPDGTEQVLYDCSSHTSEEAACSAMDPAVSFDAKTVAFTVFRGLPAQLTSQVSSKVIDPKAENNDRPWLPLSSYVLKTTEAALYLVDVASGKVTSLPHEPETFDTAPTFLPNGRLAFTSTRDGHRGTLVFGTNSVRVGTRIWSMDLDGRNLDLSSHHSNTVEEHPYVLRDGRVAYSSWQSFGGLPFRYDNGSPGGFTTLDNLFHIYTQHPDGAALFAFFGQHAGDHTPEPSPHFVG